MRELLRTQIETNTRVCGTVADVRQALRETRQIVAGAAEEHGAALMAASTHPFAAWRAQVTTPKERYERFAINFQETVRPVPGGRGCTSTPGSAIRDSRIRVMTAMRRYLPLLHALSTSSPFNAGSETGFKSFRLEHRRQACRAPASPARCGRGRPTTSFSTTTGAWISPRTAASCWWDIRPSHAYPTVEMRICDVCTRIEDAVCIAALYASLIRWLLRKDRAGELPPEPPTEIITENRWLAQRYGVLAFLGDTQEGGRIDIEDYAIRLVEALAGDARALGCEAELRHALTIIREGTGADRQVDFFRLRRLEGDTEEEALRRVVDLVLAESREGLGGAC